MVRGDGFGAIIAAAGSGTRFGAKKQFLELLGRPLLFYSLDLFSEFSITDIVVVAPSSELEATRALVGGWSEPSGRERPEVRVVPGGTTRRDSVRRGLEALGERVAWVLVHDAARPLALAEDVARLMEAVKGGEAAAIGHPSTDSVKEERGGAVVRALARERVWQVQTPQGASREAFEAAYRRAGELPHTDEASLLGAAGETVRLVEGSRENIKITVPGDLELAAFFLERRGRAVRGSGEDVSLPGRGTTEDTEKEKERGRKRG